MIKSKSVIKQLSKNKKSIKIKWSDNKISNFDFLWLRDNCPSVETVNNL